MALLVIVLVGLITRAATIKAQSFWDDELFTTWLLRMDPPAMLRRISDTEATPPLYFLIAWGWARSFGTGAIGLRSLSVLAGTSAVPVSYLAARELFSRRAALWAAALVATNPFLVWYGEEARSYALLVPATALVLLYFLRALRTADRRPLMLWGAWSAAALLVHYFAIFLVAPTGLWLAFRHRNRLAVVARAAAIPMATAMALLPLALHQRRKVGDPGAISTSPFLVRLAALPKNFLVGYALPAELLLTLVAASLAGLAGILAIRRITPMRRWVTPLGLAAAACGIPVAMAVLGIDYVTSRNLLPALIPILLLVAAGVATSRAATTLGIGLCIVSLVIVAAVAVDPIYQRKDWRGAAEAAGPPRTDRAIVFAPGFVNPGPFQTYFDTGRVVAGGSVTVSEIVVVALALEGEYGTGVPRPPRGATPVPPEGFELASRRDATTFTLVRYRASPPRRVTAERLRSLMFGDLSAAVVLQTPP